MVPEYAEWAWPGLAAVARRTTVRVAWWFLPTRVTYTWCHCPPWRCRCTTRAYVGRTSAASLPVSLPNTAKVKTKDKIQNLHLHTDETLSIDTVVNPTLFFCLSSGFYLISPSEFERFSLSTRFVVEPRCLVEVPHSGTTKQNRSLSDKNNFIYYWKW